MGPVADMVPTPRMLALTLRGRPRRGCATDGATKSAPVTGPVASGQPKGLQESPSDARINRADAEWASEARIKGEFGDLLFVMANVARHLKIDPEDSLRKANDKFTSRFHFIEAELGKRGSSPAQSNLDDMDALWNAAKATERR